MKIYDSLKEFQKYKKNLDLLYSTTHIPTYVFDENFNIVYRNPIIESISYTSDMLKRVVGSANIDITVEKHPMLYSSDTCFFAYFRLSNEFSIIFGPITSTVLTYREFFDSNKVQCHTDDMLNLYRITQQSPHITLKHFINCITLYVKLEFNVDIDIDILLKHPVLPTPIPTDNNIDQFEPQYNALKTTMNFIKSVSIHLKNANFKEIDNTFSETPLFAALKNTISSTVDYHKFFFMYAVTVFNSASEEGVDIKKAFPILDTYISRIPSIKTSTDLEYLCKQITYDYYNQIEPLKTLISPSHIVTKCLRYIHDNLYSKINISILATHCEVSTRTVIRHFTDYFSMPINEYILSEKLKEVAFLLEHSKYNISEISDMLCFSSQSHLCISFKKAYKCTPYEYRKNHLC